MNDIKLGKPHNHDRTSIPIYINISVGDAILKVRSVPLILGRLPISPHNPSDMVADLLILTEVWGFFSQKQFLYF